MKNIQVIDGADNCTYSIYSVSNEDFNILFPIEGQDIEFIEDIMIRENHKLEVKILEKMWSSPVEKSTVIGIHGTLFYQLLQKKNYYPTKKDKEMIVVI